MKSNQKLYVGFPLYLNTLPLLHYLKVPSGVKIFLKTPKEINQALEKGELDIGLASSLFYAHHFHKFLLLPDLSISTIGKVKSVILYHHLPITSLEGKKIGITPETETSFGLLRLILEDFFKVNPLYQVLSHPLSKDEKKLTDLSGYLAIGDEALTLQRKNLFPFATDLAEIWLEKTKLPFIFALMVLKRDSLSKKEHLIKKLLVSLYISRAKGLSSLGKIVEAYTLEIERDFSLNYLQHLEYDFSGLKQRAFLYFCELLYKKGSLKEIPKLEFIEI